MTAFQAIRSVATNGGAVAVLTGFFSGGIMYAGKKAVAAEREPSSAANNDGIRKLCYTPQFDGLECFETIVSTGKHPSSGKQPSATRKSMPKNHDLAIAPQFDGLHCFETFIYKN